MRTVSTIAGALIATLVLLGCLPSDPPEGVLACTSSTECPSGWSCRTDRCWRTPGSDAGPDGGIDGGTVDDAGSDAGPVDGHVPVDTGIDADPGDAGPIRGCDPLTHAECGPSQRCAWVQLGDALGETRCIDDGTVAEGGACTRGDHGDSGHDDCQRGLVCISSACTPVCDLESATSCGAGAACLRFSGLYEVGGTSLAGACRPTCDPLGRTPELTCPGTQGCYELPSSTGSTFTCAAPGTHTVGGTIDGTVYANSCVPGARPLRRTDGSNYCAAYCVPVETYSGNTAGAGGQSPNSCPEVGGSSTDACVFNWALSGSDVYDPVQNQLGSCVPAGAFQYDHDADSSTIDVDFPSCGLLPNTDTDGNGTPQHAEAGCGPYPAP